MDTLEAGGSVEPALAALLGSPWFWIAVAIAAVGLVSWGITMAAREWEYRRHSKRHSAAAYRQLHDRQEFRRIVRDNFEEDQ